jgi:hypothetical protein
MNAGVIMDIGDDVIRDRRETGRTGIFIRTTRIGGSEEFGREELYAQSDAMLSVAAKLLTHECQQSSGSFPLFRSGSIPLAVFIGIWETQTDLS